MIELIGPRNGFFFSRALPRYENKFDLCKTSIHIGFPLILIVVCSITLQGQLLNKLKPSPSSRPQCHQALAKCSTWVSC
jgi:hypothetical protein